MLGLVTHLFAVPLLPPIALWGVLVNAFLWNQREIRQVRRLQLSKSGSPGKLWIDFVWIPARRCSSWSWGYRNDICLRIYRQIPSRPKRILTFLSRFPSSNPSIRLVHRDAEPDSIHASERKERKDVLDGRVRVKNIPPFFRPPWSSLR